MASLAFWRLGHKDELYSLQNPRVLELLKKKISKDYNYIIVVRQHQIRHAILTFVNKGSIGKGHANFTDIA